MTKLVKCKALVACTEFVAGFGQVHMNPDDPDHAVVEIPAEAVARLVGDERVVVIDDPLDHDNDGKPGGSLPGAKSTAAKGKRAKAGAKSTAADSNQEVPANDEAPADADVGAETPAASQDVAP